MSPASDALTTGVATPAPPDEAAVALAFSRIPLLAPGDQAAAACHAALLTLGDCAFRLEIPLRPVPLALGAGPEGLEEITHFAAPGGEGRILAAPEVLRWPAGTLAAVSEQLARVWRVQAELAAHGLAIDQLEFHLRSLQQVTHTLAAVRERQETIPLIIDSVSEVFFAWWAVLYQSEGDEYALAGARALRGENFAPQLAARVVHRVTRPGDPPCVPTDDAELRDSIPAEIGAVASLNIGDGRAGLLILGPRMNDEAYASHHLALIGALADSSAVALRNAGLHDRLREQATIDPLTHCHNRRGFEEIMAAELARALRHAHPLCLVLMDLDRFKEINDEFGHDAGDAALQRIGRALRHHIRISDSASRFGGEEFALVFPETDRAEAVMLAERLREMVSSLRPTSEVPREITASFGVACAPGDGATTGDLVRAADRALYEAKSNGRNRVEIA
jgi:diguanylate cyclase (GGDEF)-like protein